MYTIIGRISCTSCHMVKQSLDNAGIPYRYMDIDRLGSLDKGVILKSAKDKGIMSLPIILDENQGVCTVDEVIGGLKNENSTAKI